MRTRRLGDSGLQVSVISLGSWLTFGESVDVEATRKLIAHARELGVNLFDTADVYANGQAELALGAALTGVPRHQVVLATKCFFPTSEAPTDRGLSRKHVVESVEGSLRRLGTDYLDLHQCHRYDPDTPLEETVRAYEDLIRQGKLLYWGTSLWSRDQIAAACDVADGTGGYRPVANQPVYSILRRQIELDVLPGCRELGIGQIVFSPLGQGALTGKYSGGRLPAGSRATDARLGRFMKRYLDGETLERIDALGPLADELGVSMAELALAWCLREPGVASVIVGATDAKQLEQNCRAAEVEVPDAIARQIDGLFAPGSESLPPDPDTP
jgi:voltage-dependent potassium channel beta subunit